MRAYIRRAVVPAVLVSALALAGCSGGGDSKSAAPEKTSAGKVDAAGGASETASPSASASSAPELGVGKAGTYTAVSPDDASVKTKMSVSVKSVRYVTAADLDTSNAPKNGQYAVLTLAVKNVGAQQGRFSPYGAMKWQDAKTAAQDASTLETTDGQDVDTEYAPGQSVTGDVVLDVVRKGGTVSYFDVPDGPAFTVELPA